MALYNEIEPYAVRWLRNLVDAGHVAPGSIDDRSITDLVAADLAGHRQAHFFAGIGVWSLALRLAGVGDDVPVWTGSCPCQPFSSAGRRRGTDDERHLWPEWFRLIRECRPPVIFGEQVASGDGLEWLDTVSSDLEGAGYAVGAFDLSAAGFGAPHIRQRLYFVAHTDEARRVLIPAARLHDQGQAGDHALRRGSSGGPGGGLGDAGGDRDRQHARAVSRDEGEHDDGPSDGDHAPESSGAVGDRLVGGFWRGAHWVPCRSEHDDGIVWRPVEPGTFPLAHGATARVGRLRAYGNAIAAPQAAAFIRCAVDAILDG